MAIKIFNSEEISTKINSPNMREVILEIVAKFLSRKLPIYLLSILLINIIISPLVYAGTNQILSKGQSYALTLLGLVTISLFIYLFIVIFQPEKF
ncbi:potassium-transporting ATPase subunit F [Geminocystis sp. GBBB08]|uniref:potassium-transporting ATPase subunit F n=1 Tax=Geminocystis sp. GBBB08 TaxID=2604140 RepID=UPI0027E24169|nr:potassium-transporting ATPase subunit F [Geminocystis sp. GBBB08]